MLDLESEESDFNTHLGTVLLLEFSKASDVNIVINTNVVCL